MTTIDQNMIAQSRLDTHEHIAHVRENLFQIMRNLELRAQEHDAGKLVEPELSGYALLRHRLADLEYGSEAYKEALAEAASTILHHYEHHNHHPEHYEIDPYAPSEQTIKLVESVGEAFATAGDITGLWLLDYANYLKTRRGTTHKMSLMSLMEMLADWKAASLRTKNGSIRQSLKINATRFKLTPEVAEIFQHTLDELGW